MSETNPALTPSKVDAIEDPAPFAPLAGDHSDDDGRALDDFFEGGPWAPVESEGLAYKEQSVKVANRLFGGGISLAAGVAPVMILPPDLDRKHLYFSGLVTGGDHAILIVSDSNFANEAGGDIPSLLAGNGRACFFWRTAVQSDFVLDDYTGAVWIANGGNAVSVIELSYAVVSG